MSECRKVEGLKVKKKKSATLSLHDDARDCPGDGKPNTGLKYCCVSACMNAPCSLGQHGGNDLLGSTALNVNMLITRRPAGSVSSGCCLHPAGSSPFYAA